MFFIIFFFQAEDGIRDDLVTGVQTCALPISELPAGSSVTNFLAGLPPARRRGINQGSVTGQRPAHFIGADPARHFAEGNFMDHAVPGQRRGLDDDIRSTLLEVADPAAAHEQYVASALIGFRYRSAEALRILGVDLGAAGMFGGRELLKMEILRGLPARVEPGSGLL